MLGFWGLGLNASDFRIQGVEFRVLRELHRWDMVLGQAIYYTGSKIRRN